jgi:hypothetical protein
MPSGDRFIKKLVVSTRVSPSHVCIVVCLVDISTSVALGADFAGTVGEGRFEGVGHVIAVGRVVVETG